MSPEAVSLVTAVIGGLMGGTFVIAGQAVQSRAMRRAEMRARSEDAAMSALKISVEIAEVYSHEGAETTEGYLTRSATMRIDNKKSMLGAQALLIQNPQLRGRIKLGLAVMSWPEAIHQELSGNLHPFYTGSMTINYIIEQVAAYLRSEPLPQVPTYVREWKEAQDKRSREGRGTWIRYDDAREDRAEA
ncbi:hypothetical protein GA0070607_5966 [Micromonospora coriariae]|uniref:Uncharacterized protein n=1 Tax=Micromonospora coriariae TaxID=285665 RepID=A0A1C4XYN1_9ACTN|nr:hypothetical protein [Micromonospora coriariae]SCF13558.1 hypothetical protein GA0070607_5966 [Micromonospora coriariae]